jgi:hypothetical protein
MDRFAHVRLAHAMEGLMKAPFEHIKGLGAWYVAASAFGRDRLRTDGRERIAPRSLPGRPFVVAGRAPTSGLMTLRAVCESEGRMAAIVDFEWAYVSPLAARLLDHDARELVGRRMLTVLDEERERSVLFRHYRSVIEEGAGDPIERAHVIDGKSRVLRHNVLRLGEGVLVTLSDLSASREQDAPRVQWTRLDSAFGQQLNLVQAGK